MCSVLAMSKSTRTRTRTHDFFFSLLLLLFTSQLRIQRHSGFHLNAATDEFLQTDHPLGFSMRKWNQRRFWSECVSSTKGTKSRPHLSDLRKMEMLVLAAPPPQPKGKCPEQVLSFENVFCSMKFPMANGMSAVNARCSANWNLTVHTHTHTASTPA